MLCLSLDGFVDSVQLLLDRLQMGCYGIAMFWEGFIDKIVLVVAVRLDDAVTADQLLVGLTEQV